MGKVKPPAEVYYEWTPEQQAGYQGSLDGMAAKKDGHMAAHDKEMAKAKSADKWSDNYDEVAVMERPKTSQDYKDGCGGAMIGNMYMANKERERAKQHRENAKAEKQKADELDAEINRLTIEEGGQCTEDPAKIKADFKKEAQENIAADHSKYDELKQKKKDLQQELDNTWFFGKDDLRQQIADVQAQMDEIYENITFNQQNLDNTFPEPPPPPPPPPVTMPPAPTFVTMGAKLSCPLAIPCGATLIVDPSRKELIGNKFMANIMDFVPLKNIPSMGQCTTMSNPAVAAATAAKLGVYTPAPCVPAIPAPWKPGHTTLLVENFPALLNTDTLQCMWGGVITILPG
jgi:hypothetical protein